MVAARIESRTLRLAAGSVRLDPMEDRSTPRGATVERSRSAERPPSPDAFAADAKVESTPRGPEPGTNGRLSSPDALSFQRRSHFENLDGLRGVSILLVLLHHTTDLPSGILRTFQLHAALGVPVFFAISGFLITTLLLREESERGRISLPKFFGRRAVRLLPLYYVVLGAYCVLILGLRMSDPAAIEAFRERLPGYLIYASNVLAPIEGPFSHAWSLAYEEQFYLVFGLAMGFLPRALLVGLAGVLGALYLAPLATFGAWDPKSVGVLRALLFFPPSIVHGVCLGFLLSSAAGYRAACALARPAIAFTLLAITFALLATRGIRATPALECLPVLSIALLVTSCVLQRELPILGGRALSYVGKISYGIYLQHVLCRHVFVKLTGIENPWLVLLGMLALSVPIAHLSYQYFEAPLMRRFAPYLSTRAAAGDRTAR